MHQREDAVASLEYEAQARVQDPVYGCVGILCVLQVLLPNPEATIMITVLRRVAPIKPVFETAAALSLIRLSHLLLCDSLKLSSNVVAFFLCVTP